MQIPPAYLRHIEPIVAKAKGFLENGEALTPMAFVGSFANNTVIPIMLDGSDHATKDRSATMIAAAAAQADADYVFTVIEAWALPKKYLSRVDQVYEKYGSLENFPQRLEVASFTLETRHGTWIAQCTIQPKPPSKKRRTIMPPQFVFRDAAQGHFANLLPVKHGQPAGSTSQ